MPAAVRRAGARLRIHTQRAYDEGDGHGGLEALATDIADDDEGRAVGDGQHLEEVPAHLLRGKIGRLNPQPGNLAAGNPESALLHRPRRLDLGRDLRLLPGQPHRAQHNDDQQRDPEVEGGNVIREESYWPTTKAGASAAGELTRWAL